MATSNATIQNEVRNTFTYKKRSGTAGLATFLYKSHLASLMLSRNINDSKEFVLGCNVDEIGNMSEICFRFIHNDNDKIKKPVAVFIKAKYKQHITDDDLNNPKSNFNLYRSYQSHILIKERFDSNADELFKGKFDSNDSIEPYFVIYTPNQCKIKNPIAVSKDDKIYSDKVNSIIGTRNNNMIFQVQDESLMTNLIHAKIEMIAKTIAAYVTICDEKNKENICKEMKNVFEKYRSLLIPHVIKINELDENCSGEFNESLHENSNSYIKFLRVVLYKEVLMKSKVINEESSQNIQLLHKTNACTAELLSKLIGTVITFDQNTNKLAYIPGTSDEIKKEPLDGIQIETPVVDEALVIAGMKALKCIKMDFNNSDIKKIIIEMVNENEDKNLDSVFEDEKQAAKQFLKHLYIYAEQGKENTVSKCLEEEIIKKLVTRQKSTIFQSKSEVALAKFYYNVQKWILSMDKPQYLTNSCDFWEDITSIADPHLSILNYNSIMELQKYSLEFKSESFDSFSKLDSTQSPTNIISNNVLLTSIKLMQYFSNKSCLFVNFDYVRKMKDIEFNMLIEEVNKVTIKTLVVIFYGTMKYYTTKCSKFKDIVNSFHGNLVSVSAEDFEAIYDRIKGFDDTYNGGNLLQYDITVYGENRKLGMVVGEKAKDLINAEILYKIIRNESIQIGKSFKNSFYNEIEDCFMDRQLCAYASSCDTFINHISCGNHPNQYETDDYDHFILEDKPFEFFHEIPVVVIFAESGMGKSTLLTDLAIKMNRVFPNKWIIKMNLLEYSEDFFKWDEKETDVDILKSMHLVCRAELNHKPFNEHFTIEKQSDGDLVLRESKGLEVLHPIALLHLKLIIHYFNTGNIIFLLDGFDEICPHYEKVGVRFMKSLANNTHVTVDDNSECFGTLDNLQVYHNKLCTAKNSSVNTTKEVKSKNQLLITSRSYNTTKTTLVTEFNIKPLYLSRLAKHEQLQFYQKYWETRIKLEELTSDQFQNVEAFFEYMNRHRIGNDLCSENSTSMLLCCMQEAAVEYLRSKVDSSANSNINKKDLLTKWISSYEMLSAEDYSRFTEGYLDELQLTGTLLHMKIYAELFVNEIKDTSSPKIWDMGVHTFEFYNRFLEIKLKKIRLEEKAGENTSANLTEYKDLLAEVTEEHKKLAFYAFFYNASSHFKKILTESQWETIQSIIERIKMAEEKTGLIDRIDNGVPQFVHVVFAEYYAVEYVADMLKKKPLTDAQVHRQIEFVINCLLNNSVGIMTAFNHKLKNDEKLRKVLDKHSTRKFIFTVWMEQDRVQEEQHEEKNEDVTIKLNKDSFLQKILRNELIETARLLVTSIKDNLNTVNIEKFVDIIGSDFFEFALDYEELIVYVLNAIRVIDPLMLVKALSNCGLQIGDLPDNDLIIKHLRDKPKSIRAVVVKSTDAISGNNFCSIGGIYRWS